jgi:hypothetical protein
MPPWPWLTGAQRLAHHVAMTRELHPFRFRDPVTGKWVRARYRATLQDIAARYATWEVTGSPSTPPGASSGFDPYRKLMSHAQWARLSEPPLQMDPDCRDALEHTLVQTFLRRYVTYCARRGRYAQMNGAARLLKAVQADGHAAQP